jgi:hypothetical protein
MIKEIIRIEWHGPNLTVFINPTSSITTNKPLLKRPSNGRRIQVTTGCSVVGGAILSCFCHLLLVFYHSLTFTGLQRPNAANDDGHDAVSSQGKKL